MRRLAVAVIFFYTQFVSADEIVGVAKGKTLPLYELGVGAGLSYAPDYPGSSQNELWALPVPYLIYRGDIFRADKHGGARARITRDPVYEFSLSGGGGLPSSSGKNQAREGMPDLEWLGEVGPAFTIRLQTFDSGGLIKLTLPLRIAVSTNFYHFAQRGFIFGPSLLWEAPELLSKQTDAFAILTSDFADTRYMGYFYDVPAEYVTPDRAAYDAKPGYLETTLTLGLGYRFQRDDLQLLGITSLSSLNGATNSTSPLMKSRNNLGCAVVLIWTFSKSSELISADE